MVTPAARPQAVAHACEGFGMSQRRDDDNPSDHRALGNLPPAAYAKLSDPAMRRDRIYAHSRASRPVPLHHRARQGQVSNRLHSSTDEKKSPGQIQRLGSTSIIIVYTETGLNDAGLVPRKFR